MYNFYVHVDKKRFTRIFINKEYDKKTKCITLLSKIALLYSTYD